MVMILTLEVDVRGITWDLRNDIGKECGGNKRFIMIGRILLQGRLHVWGWKVELRKSEEGKELKRDGGTAKKIEGNARTCEGSKLLSRW